MDPALSACEKYLRRNLAAFFMEKAMEIINQMLINNRDQRLTAELINGMAHTIRVQFEEQKTQHAQELEALSMALSQDQEGVSDVV